MTDRRNPAGSFEELPRYRAPREHGQWLVAPALPSLAGHGGHVSAISRWQSKLEQVSLGGGSLAALRSTARRDAFDAAVAHTSRYRDLWFDPSTQRPLTAEAAWIVAGHQPELFHPGVWFKNFLLSRSGQLFARPGQTQSLSAVPLNLVIDNDLCRSPAIRVPTREDSNSRDWRQVRTETIMFDAPAPAVAWECRPIMDQAAFDSFPDRIRGALASEIEHPMVDRLWRHARSAAKRTGRLGLALAEARHALEGELGLETLELPLGQLCNQVSFARFSLAVLSELARFQSIYNSQRAAYRKANGIRSESHPVPGLTTRHGWIEAPWWIYRLESPTRRRLFARLDGNNLLLSDQAGWQAMVEGPLDGDDALQDWMQFAIDGVLLRPRALITTMFVRLVISDLFMHGIGGGKYDQMTDAIIGEFFGIEPPPMCVATATLQLPLERGTLASDSELRAAVETEQTTIRHLRYQPEEHLQAPDAETIRLLEQKKALLANIPPRGQKWEWHQQMSGINKRLAELNTQAVQRSQQRLQELAVEQRQLKLLQSREFSFCLFDLDRLAPALSAMAEQAAFPPSAK